MRKSIFLVGPTPRVDPVTKKPSAPSWRVPEALTILEELGYDGHVFVPENRPGSPDGYNFDAHDCFPWETAGLHRADIIVIWVPRDLKTMPAFTTNVEAGEWMPSGKAVYGAPLDQKTGGPLPKNVYLDLKAKFYNVARGGPSLRETLRKAVLRIGDGAERSGGECTVPIEVWRSEPFQRWYKNLKAVGNRLEEARVRWRRRTDDGRVFSFVIDAKIWITSESRFKTVDAVVSRLDLSAIMLWRRKTSDILDSEIVLVKEFRSAGRTPDGFIHELPGGSTVDPKKTPLEIAQNETQEETGVLFPLERFKEHGSRQLAGTWSTHHAHLFSVELTEDELAGYSARNGEAVEMGIPGSDDTERTYIEVKTIRQILNESLVDWTTLGMIMQVLQS